MTTNHKQSGIRLLSTIAMTFLASVLCLSTNFGQDADSQPQEPAAMELRLQFARLNLKLAETELKLAEQFNRELIKAMPQNAPQRQQIIKMKQIPETVIARLESNVAIGQIQLSQAESPSTGSPEKIRERYAEEKVKLAAINLDAAKAGKAEGKPVPRLEIARLELIYELAKLKLELVGSPENVLTLVDSLQRQIDRLSEELLTHDQRITAIEDRLTVQMRDLRQHP